MIAAGGPTVSNVMVRAELVLDDEGHPVAVCSRKLKHYKVALWLEGVPEDTHAVTYVLHESYRDPIREVLDGPRFCLEVTTYGDYDVVANVRRRRFGEQFTARLSDALAASHPSPTPEIRRAIEDIRSHH